MILKITAVQKILTEFLVEAESIQAFEDNNFEFIKTLGDDECISEEIINIEKEEN